MEVGIPRANAAYAVLTHQNGGVGVMHEIACELRHLTQHLLRDGRMLLRWRQQTEAWHCK